MREPIPQAEFERARRKACRRIASALIRGMAETDASFATMARRLNQDETIIRDWMHSLIEGTNTDLDIVSDLALAMGTEIEFSLTRYQDVQAPAQTPTAQAA